MAERSYPFVYEAGSTTTQGRTTDAEYSAMMSVIVEDGVVGDGDLKPYGTSAGLQVKIPAGDAFVRGHYYRNSGTISKTVDAGSTQARIDLVVLRMEYGNVNDIHVVVKKGTPSASPAAPPLTQTDTGVYEFVLGRVNVPANAATITAGNVVDMRVKTGPEPHSLDSHTGSLDGARVTGKVPSATSADDAVKVGGNRIFVQSGTPSGATANDLWVW